MKSRSRRSRVESRPSGRRGAVALHLVVILVPVIFAFVGFAVDLGTFYAVRGELKTAANAMALAAAQQLIGVDSALDRAEQAALLTVENSSGFGNRFYFHGYPVGQAGDASNSTVATPVYYSTAASAIASEAGDASGAQARYVRFTVTGEPRLIFWSFIPTATGRTISVAATAVAGISAPLCQACAIEPLAVAALTLDDAVDFGFIAGNKYSLTHLCVASANAPQPPVLPGASQRVSYVLLNRQDPNSTAFPDDQSQAWRSGAAGLPGSTDSALGCFRVSNPETLWPGATVGSCAAIQVPAIITGALCGIATRFESAAPNVCAGISGADAMAGAFSPDTDIAEQAAYPEYTGNGRRIITVPVTDAVSGTTEMTVLGFRQFLVMPDQGGSNINPADRYGRFAAMYIGSVAPLRQGRFDGCTQTAGPGKVVLHQ